MISMLFYACASTSEVDSEKTASSRISDENKTEVSQQAEKTETVAGPKGNQMTFDEKDYVLKRYDINKDGTPDMVHVFKKISDDKTGENSLRIYVKMMDLNRDSKFDMWRFFDLETGAIAKEELDFDFDGKIDRTDYFSAGVVRRSEFDSQFDENPDIIKSFDEKGVVVKVESDQNGDGKIDYWEYYKNGVLERIEKDTDNDGKSDVFKRMGDTGFTKIVDVDARFEMPEETAEKEQPAENVKDEEIKSDNTEAAAEAEAAKPEAEAAKPEAEAAKPEAEAAKPEAEAAKPEAEAAKTEAEAAKPEAEAAKPEAEAAKPEAEAAKPEPKTKGTEPNSEKETK